MHSVSFGNFWHDMMDEKVKTLHYSGGDWLRWYMSDFLLSMGLG